MTTRRDPDEEGAQKFSLRDMKSMAGRMLLPQRMMLFVAAATLFCIAVFMGIIAFSVWRQDELLDAMRGGFWGGDDAAPPQCFSDGVPIGTCTNDGQCPRFKVPDGLLITYSCVVEMCFAHLEVRREGVWPGMPQTLCDALVDGGSLQPCIRVTPIVDEETLVGCGVSFRATPKAHAVRVHDARLGSLSPTSLSIHPKN